MSVWGTPEEFVERLVGKGPKARVESELFTAWTLGASHCKTGGELKTNPYKHDTAEWRAWGRGFRAWEWDAKHRKAP